MTRTKEKKGGTNIALILTPFSLLELNNGHQEKIIFFIILNISSHQWVSNLKKSPFLYLRQVKNMFVISLAETHDPLDQLGA